MRNKASVPPYELLSDNFLKQNPKYSLILPHVRAMTAPTSGADHLTFEGGGGGDVGDLVKNIVLFAKPLVIEFFFP